MYQPPFYKLFFHNVRRQIAKQWLTLMPVTQIAITGSQGKTNTSSMLYHLLSALGTTVRTDLNLDTTYNVPITALKIRPTTTYAIFELGVDHIGEMDAHLEIVKPNIAIITGISPVHTDSKHFGSFENLILEKRKLIERLPGDGYAILNGDDLHVRAMSRFTKAKIIYYGLKSTNDFAAKDITNSLSGLSLRLTTPTEAVRIGQSDQAKITTHLIGLHHAYTIMASYALYRVLGFSDFDRFAKLISTIKPLEGRMSLKNGPLDTVILDDSLRANPASTTSGLCTLSELEYKKGRKIAVLAEMGELEHPEKEHQKIGDLITKLNIDYLILMGKYHIFTYDQAIKNGFDKNHIWHEINVKTAAERLKTIIKPNDLLYLKGSLLRKVERILMILEGKKVECTISICPFYHHCDTCQYRETGYNES